MLAVIALFIVLVVSPTAYQDAVIARGFMDRAGCRAELVTSEMRSIFESGFSAERNTLYYGTGDIEALPDSGRTVLFHEIGHCLQHQSGLTEEAYRGGSVVYELDADRLGADIACRLGYNGVRDSKEFIEWVHATYGYTGDTGHGSIWQRKRQSDYAWSCQPPEAA